MNELELIRKYAMAWNSLDPKVIEPYLAEAVVYESQQVFGALVGKERVFGHLAGKMKTIRNNLAQSKVYAEVGYCGSQEGHNVQVWSAPEGRPCVLMAQGNPDQVIALVLLETEEAKIRRIDICTSRRIHTQPLELENILKLIRFHWLRSERRSRNAPTASRV